MTDRPPRVTVLMPVYNGERFLRGALESILSQTFTDFEFLIIDDGSTDQSAEIVRTYNDSRIRLVQNESNLKLTASLNRGLSLARGEYIARMDADDVCMPERLEKQVRFLDENQHVDILGTDVEMIDHAGALWLGSKPFRLPRKHGAIRWMLYFVCPIYHPTVMMRRTVMDSLDGYSLDFPYAEDYDLWLRAAAQVQIGNVPDILLKLRIHESSKVAANTRLHEKYSELAVQNATELTLGKEVSANSIRFMREPYFVTSAEGAHGAARLLSDLYMISTDPSETSRPERSSIRTEAVKNLGQLAVACFAFEGGEVHRSALLSYFQLVVGDEFQETGEWGAVSHALSSDTPVVSSVCRSVLGLGELIEGQEFDGIPADKANVPENSRRMTHMLVELGHIQFAQAKTRSALKLGILAVRLDRRLMRDLGTLRLLVKATAGQTPFKTARWLYRRTKRNK